MSNIVSRSVVNKKSESFNYLEHPVISSYFISKEVKAYYLSIKHVDDRRDFHSTLIAAFREFLSLVAEDDGIEILNSCIFSKSKSKVRARDKNIKPTNAFERINPEGCEILNLKAPLTFESLKSAYKKAVMKHHPDRGGVHETMLIINGAYQEYQEYLCANLESGSSNSTQELVIDRLNIEPQNANDYIYLLNARLAEVYCDEWDIINSYRTVKKLREQQFYGSQLVDNFEEKFKMAEMALTLTKRLAAANMHLEADDAMAFTRHIYEIYGFNFNEYFKSCLEETKNILTGIKKLKLIINHTRQADNALSNGVISKKQYDSLLQKFSEKSSAKIDRERMLKDFLNTSKFIDELSYDKGANKAHLELKNVPGPSYFEDKRLHKLPKDQQAEYFMAFSVNSSLDLVKKYAYVRLVSYILSMSGESEQQLFEKICNECSLLFNIYNDSQRKNINTKKLIERFNKDMESIRDFRGGNKQQIIDAVKNKYIFYLTAGKIAGKKKCPFV